MRDYRTHSYIIPCLALLLSQACTIDNTTYAPLGNNVSLEGSWSINGYAPEEDALLCSDAGVSEIQLVFRDGNTDVLYDSFFFDCNDGFFSTEPTPVLEYGLYTIQYSAIDLDGLEVARSEELFIDATISTHIIIDNVDFQLL